MAEMVCITCMGKGFVHFDGTAVNAFEGYDGDCYMTCPRCHGLDDWSGEDGCIEDE